MISVPYEVKKALRDGMLRKNYRFVVLNDDGTEDFTIDNDTLVSESVSIDERMCSGDTIQYGLCEGSSLEFQYFNHPNITGRRVQVFIDVEYDATGTYTKVNEFEEGVENVITEGGYYRVYSNTPNAWTKTILRNGTSFVMELTPTSTATETYQDLVLTSWDSLEVVWGSIDPATHPVELQKMVEGMQWHTIPLGYFDVEKCSRQASTGIMKVTAYNKLQSDYLDQKANELLLESVDDPTMDITMYSIRKTLLEHFQVEPYEQTQKQAELAVSSVPPTALTLSVKLSDLTSDGGPINYYSLLPGAQSQGRTLNTNTVLRIYIQMVGSYWTVGPDDYNHYQLLQSGHDFSTLSESFVDYLIHFLDACPLTKSGETIIGEIKNNTSGDKGWRDLFSLKQEQATGGGYSYSYYNDYGYKYQNNGSYPVNGTTKDFMKRLFSGPLYSAISYLIPYMLEVRLVSGSSEYMIYNVHLLGEGSISYGGSGGSTKTYPKFKYEDGSDIPDWNVGDTSRPFDSWFSLYEIENISSADLVTVEVDSMPDFTLREITTASYETLCQFGQLSRTTDLFEGVELNNGGLYPAEDLYPADDLYPSGASLSASKAMYSQLWADEGNKRKWRYLIITYKGLDGDNNEAEFTLQRTVNADGTDDYNMSDNWLFRNLIWTAQEVGDYADAMVAKMQNNEWFPFEMWCAGLPYLETGDQIEIPLNGEVYKSYILQRQLKGIQNLQDTYVNGTLDIF